MTDETETVDGEIVTDVSEGGEPGSTRRLRVYDHTGDFIITIPSDARVTFGYFNPATPQNVKYGGGYNGQDNVARQTALRIYEGTTDKFQLACFLGTKGFRDLRIDKVTMRQSVTITHNVEDDGFGNIKLNAEQTAALNAGREDDEDTVLF